jgi:hypothetical protein
MSVSLLYQRTCLASLGLLFFIFFYFLFFRDRVSLCSPGCLGTHSVDQAGLELRNSPASASQVLGLKAVVLFLLFLFLFVLSSGV